MKQFFPSSILAFLFVIYGLSIAFMACQPANSSTQVNSSIRGSWEFLHSTSTFPDTVLSFDSTDVRSIYVISKDHFSFISIAPETDSLMFAGFGKYTLEDGNYVEKVDFHTSEFFNNTSIIFDSKVEHDRWTHEGYIPIDKEDSLSTALAKGQNQYELKEVRRRLPVPNPNERSSVSKEVSEKYEGVWHLESVTAQYPDTSVTLTDDNLKSIYQMEGDHFALLYFDIDSKQVDLAEFGTYEILNDSTFLETIEYHSILKTLKNNQVSFSSKIEGDTWTRSAIRPVGEGVPLEDYAQLAGLSTFKIIEVRRKDGGK